MKHLTELFTFGKEVKVEAVDASGNTVEFEVYMAKPTSSQHQNALWQARSAQAKRITVLQSTEGFDDLIDAEIPTDESELDELCLALVREELHKQAYNDVLYSDEVGSDWSGEGFDLLALASALADRSREIVAHNEANPDDPINVEEDETLVALNAKNDLFWGEVDERFNELADMERRKNLAFGVTEKRERLRKAYLDLETQAAWIDAFRSHLLQAAVRFPDNKKKHYFSSAQEVADLPDYVTTQLWDAYTELAVMNDDLKN